MLIVLTKEIKSQIECYVKPRLYQMNIPKINFLTSLAIIIIVPWEAGIDESLNYDQVDRFSLNQMWKHRHPETHQIILKRLFSVYTLHCNIFET